MSYKALIVAEMKSMLPETAKAIQKFAASGGKVIYVKNTPERSPGFKNADKNDLKVKEAVRESLDAGAKLVDAPDDETDLRGWVLNTLAEVDYDWKLKIEQPRDGLYHVRQKSLDEDILFFANTYREEVSASRVDFDLGDKGLWHWNPETGERTPYAMPYDENGFNIHLRPLESVLLVTGKKYKVDPKPTKVTDSLAINGPWKVTLKPAQSGKTFTLNMDTLKEFTQDERLAKFSGVASYETTFNVKDKSYTHIELGKDNDFVSEIWLNGTKVGVNWYGIQHLNISDALKKGKNELRIEYTTTLYNMLTTKKGIRFQPEGSQRTGLLGPVKLLKKRTAIK